MTHEGPPEPVVDGSPSMPSRLGKYEVLARLGQGAMGVVYHAHDPHLDRDVAVKVMLPAAGEDPEQKLRFEREARAVARLVHPNVVTVFDLGYHTDGSPYIAMEMLRGHDLQHVLRQGPALSLDRKVSTIAQTLDALHQAHAAGIVHRDIKPANVFLTDDGVVKIMDFGIARFTMSSVTSTGVVIGTADYMSPEQVSGARVDGRSDLFSAGAVLCELVTGQRPFHGESLVTVFFKIVHEEPRIEVPPGSEYADLLPVLKKALAKDLAERYQTAAEFGDALREYQKSRQRSHPTRSQPAPTGVAPGLAAGRGDETMDLGPLVLHLDFGLEPVHHEPLALAPLLPPPPADPTPVFRLLRQIDRNARSGDLHFRHGHERRYLRFLDGQVLYGTSDVRGEHLGDVLVRYGRLDQARLDQAVETVLRERKRLGGVLLGMGCLDRDGLNQAVGLHAREILFDCSDRGGGSFTFEESAPQPMGEDEGLCNLTTVELILETARRVQAPGIVRRCLGDGQRSPVAARDAFNRFRNIALTPADGFLLSRIDGKLQVRDLCKLIPLPVEDVERSLFGLLATGVVEYADEVEMRTPATGSRRISVPGVGPTPVSVPPPSPPSRLPVTEPGLFRPSYATAASEAGRDFAAERLRSEEDEKSLEAARLQIEQAHDGLEGKDHFEFLGISRATTDAQVKEAYFRLAKPFHPDTRLDPRLAVLQGKRDAVFLRLGQSYEALRTASGRKRYLESLGHATQIPKNAVLADDPATDGVHAAWIARENVALAESHHREGRYWDAIQLLESTIPRLEGADRVRARVALARTQMKNPNWVKRAEESLHVILHESPNSVDACLVLGELYRTSQMRTRALAMYRRALDIDPENRDALAAVRFLQGPQAPQTPSETGRIRKMFGKAG